MYDRNSRNFNRVKTKLKLLAIIEIKRKKKPISNTISIKNDSYLSPEIIVIFLT